jgi:hypothetical protein
MLEQAVTEREAVGTTNLIKDNLSQVLWIE